MRSATGFGRYLTGGLSVGGERRRLSRTWRILLATVVVLLLVLAVATARLLVWPTQGMPTSVNAIVMLAGPGDRMPVALRLAADRKAPVLVVSQGHVGYGGPCPPTTAAPGTEIICFDPDPADTRGELEFAARMAKQRQWRSVVLVTTPEQATRARIMMGRCYSGQVYVVTGPVPARQFPYEIAYGWGALFKALILQRAC